MAALNQKKKKSVIKMEIIRQMSDSSVEINKTSRGYTYSVKAYGKDVEEIKEKLDKLKEYAEKQIKED